MKRLITPEEHACRDCQRLLRSRFRRRKAA